MKKKKESARHPGVHTAVRLPPEVLEKLRQSERGVSEEIRDRIARTLAEDEIDPNTRDLLNRARWLAEFLRSDFGGEWWYGAPRAHAAFAAGVAELLAHYKPIEPPQADPTAVGFSDLLDPPDTVGRLRARDMLRTNPTPYLEALAREHSKRGHRFSARHTQAKKEGNDDQT